MRIIKQILMVFILIGVMFAVRGVDAQNNPAMNVRVNPLEVRQGRTSMLSVVVQQDVTRVMVRFNGAEFPLYRAVTGDWVGFLPADMGAERGANPFEVTAYVGDEALPPVIDVLNIVWGGFLYQDIQLPNSLVGLLDPELNRYDFDTLISVYRRYTPEKLWKGDFQLPVPGPQISELGGIRNYNQG
ncbi:MAG TPA: hypothetical protein VJZ27_01505, partial [Aggregatilineales bacterium]|nr:hypothetical protein [Aggregatilineales bacterium]